MSRKKAASNKRGLSLTMNLDDLSNVDSADAVCQDFAKKFKTPIEAFAGVDANTEHQMDNFGPGSAWIYEAGIQFTFRHEEDQVTLTLNKTV